MSSHLCGFSPHCDWLFNIPDENVTESSGMSYCYQTYFCGGTCGSGNETIHKTAQRHLIDESVFHITSPTDSASFRAQSVPDLERW